MDKAYIRGQRHASTEVVERNLEQYFPPSRCGYARLLTPEELREHQLTGIHYGLFLANGMLKDVKPTYGGIHLKSRENKIQLKKLQ